MTAPFLRLIAWLLKRRLSPEWSEFALGDLAEEYTRRRSRSHARAALWLGRQAIHCVLTSSLDREPHHRSRGPLLSCNPGHYLRHATRAVRARPLLTATCLAIIALGVSTATVVSAGVYTLLYRPLPLPESQRLVSGFAQREGFDPFGTSLLEFSTFRSHASSLEATGLARQQTSAVRIGTANLRVQIAVVTADYLDTVGVTPSMGRSITTSDDRPGAPVVAVVSHAFWSRHLGQRADAVGATLAIDGRPTAVVGIMPSGFDLPFAAEIWLPLQLSIDALPLEQRLQSAYSFIARLRRDVPFEQANTEVAAIARSLAEEYPQRRGWSYRLIPLRQQLIGDIDGRTTRIVGVLVVAVVFLLGICCVNAANLLLLRAAERERDEAVRLAIGASRGQLIVERASEHVFVGLTGGAAGVAASAWIAPIVTILNPIRAAAFSPVLTELHFDDTVLTIGATISVITGIVVGAVPSVRLLPSTHFGVLLAASAQRTGLSRRHKTRLRFLVAAQVAVAVLLLVVGGLVLRSFAALRNIELGFRPGGLLSSELTLPSAAYQDHPRRAANLDQLVAAVRGLPGVVNAGITTNIPLQRVSFDSIFTVEGRPTFNPNDVPITAHRVVTPDYLRLIGVRLVRGRLLSESDTAESPRVVVVSEELAKQAWPGRDPIGRRIRRGRSSDTRPWLTVVGVVADVKEDRFNFRIDRAAWYLPYAQEDSTAPPNLVVRAQSDPGALADAIRRVVRASDPAIALSEPVSLEVHVDDLISTERFAAVLLSLLALSGLLLATLGLYGAISHIVRAQRPEMALRIAVGAPRIHVVRVVIREVCMLTLAGTIAGLSLAAAAANPLSAILYRVGPYDAVTYATVTLVLIVASAVAACGPASRAVRVDPARLLH